MNFSSEIPQNFSDSSKSSADTKPWYVILQATALLFIMLSTLVGNSLVCLCLFFVKEMRTVTGMFLAGLAISDLGVGLSCVPMAIAALLDIKVLKNEATCSLNAFCLVFFFVASINTLTATSVYKYVTVVYPWWPIITKKRARYITAGIWSVAFLMAIGPVIGWSRYQLVNERQQCSPSTPRSPIEYSHIVMLLLAGYVVPLVTMVFCYTRIYLISKQHFKRMQSNSIASEQERSLLSSETRLIKTFIIVLVAFVFCWLPFVVYMLFGIIHAHIPAYLPIIAFYCGYGNSAFNPVVYALRLASFRRGFKEILVACLKKRTGTLARFSSDNTDVRPVQGRGFPARKSGLAYFTHAADNTAHAINGPSLPSNPSKTSNIPMNPIISNSHPVSPEDKNGEIFQATEAVSPKSNKNGGWHSVIIKRKEQRATVIDNLEGIKGNSSNVYERRLPEPREQDQEIIECNQWTNEDSANASDNCEDDLRNKIVSLTETMYSDFLRKMSVCHLKVSTPYGEFRISRCIKTRFDIHVITNPTNEEREQYGNPCIHKVKKTVTWEDTSYNSLGGVTSKSESRKGEDELIGVELLPAYMKDQVRSEVGSFVDLQYSVHSVL